MKNTKVTGFIISVSALVTMTIVGCSESTHVEEKVNVKPDAVNVTPNKVVKPADKDVNVNVKVGNNAPAPVVHEQTTTHVINVERKSEPQTQEKQVVINNNITAPAAGTTVTKETKTDLGTGTTQTTEVQTGSNY